MRRILLGIMSTLTILLATAGVASAHGYKSKVTTTYTLPPSYTAVYCYPTGTYWQAQLGNPNNATYYATNNAHYVHNYGVGTEFC